MGWIECNCLAQIFPASTIACAQVLFVNFVLCFVKSSCRFPISGVAVMNVEPRAKWEYLQPPHCCSRLFLFLLAVTADCRQHWWLTTLPIATFRAQKGESSESSRYSTTINHSYNVISFIIAISFLILCLCVHGVVGKDTFVEAPALSRSGPRSRWVACSVWAGIVLSGAFFKTWSSGVGPDEIKTKRLNCR